MRSNPYALFLSVVFAVLSSFSSGALGQVCTNIAPDSYHSCQQQAEWGKCGQSWMQGFCNASCGRCSTDGGKGSYPVASAFQGAVETAKVEASWLNEISGLGVSYKNPGVFWVHNDSGGAPAVYAINRYGKYLGELSLNGIGNVDWEDLSVARVNGKEYIYVADFGDNSEQRDSYKIYRLEEPYVDPYSGFSDYSTDYFDTFEYTYPDGKHNAEGLAIHPNGAIYVIQKAYTYGHANVYRFPYVSPGSKVQLDFVGRLQLWDTRQVTGADFHRNGDRLVLIAYSSRAILEYRHDFNSTGWFDVSPSQVMMPGNRSESVAYDPHTGGIWEIPEGSGAQIYSHRNADICGKRCGGFNLCCSGASSDHSGNGWGWENGQTCIVKGSEAEKSQCGTASFF